MAEYTIRIPNWFPVRLNEMQGRHWAVGARRKKADRNLIACYTAHLPKATTRRRVQLVLEMAKGQRKPDPDSMQKGLHDALKHAGMLVNDSDAWVEMTHPIYVRSGTEFFSTTIRLTDI